MLRWGLVRLLLIALSFASVSIALATVPDRAIRYWYLYYSPVIITAVSFGLRGALAGCSIAILCIIIFFDRVSPLLQDVREGVLMKVSLVTGAPAAEVAALLSQVAGTPLADAIHNLAAPFDVSADLPIIVAGMIVLTLISTVVGWLVDENKRKEWLLEERADKDGMTGLWNHRRFHELLEQEVARSQRYGRTVGLLFMDIDDLKQYNDKYGHQAGDGLIKYVASALCKTVRAVDVVSRYGGDEFAVILPETGAREAKTAADRIRSYVVENPYLNDHDSPIGLTLSIGVAVCPDHAKDKDTLIRVADIALYEAKSSGGNKVCAYEIPDEGGAQQSYASSSG
ncbi:MAG: diguanylate cyclase [Dehalococcoidia bacterium]|nr:diguanylate cyclase [Dehalococcoidia bacterium]